MKLLNTTAQLVGLLAALVASPAAPVLAQAGGAAAAAEPAETLEDGPIADHQVALLTLAHETASKMPLMPHVKNRSRAQERVVVALLELDQPARALAFAEDIANFRKGTCLADVACWAAEHGHAAVVPGLLERAEREAVKAENEPRSQDWRPARVRAKIARAYALLGDFERAVEIEAGVGEHSETGLVESVRLEALEEDEFDAKLAQILELTEFQEFEGMRLAMRSLETMHGLFYADDAKRARIEEVAGERFVQMPLDLQLDLWIHLGDNAVENGNAEHAVGLLDRGRKVLDSIRWSTEHHVPMLARLAAARHRAGQTERAASILEGAMAMFVNDLAQIEDFRRTEVLTPVAEAHAARRDAGAAHAVYARCLTELVRNPNARVRTDDLVEVCCSMARHGVEPSPELLEGLRAAGAAMKDPW